MKLQISPVFEEHEVHQDFAVELLDGTLLTLENGNVHVDANPFLHSNDDAEQQSLIEKLKSDLQYAHEEHAATVRELQEQHASLVSSLQAEVARIKAFSKQK